MGVAVRERAYLDVHVADVTDYVLLIVKHGKTGDAFVVHEQEGISQGTVSINGHDDFGAHPELLQRPGVQRLGGSEVLMVLPEEAHETELTDNTYNF